MQKKLTTKKFGARYGKSVREKYAAIESKQRRKQKCPFCNKTAKRAASGIWECQKCGKRFASGAYYLESKK